MGFGYKKDDGPGVGSPYSAKCITAPTGIINSPWPILNHEGNILAVLLN